MRIRLIIPCHNEAGRFPLGDYERSLATRPTLSLLFVDDGSTDRTGTLLRDLCARYPDRCALLSLPVNAGKGEAVRQGMLRAAAEGGSFDYYGYFDADLAIPLDEAFLFFAFLQDRRPAFILSARVKLLGTARIERRLYRHLLGRTFATLVSIVTTLAVYDTQAGAKLVRTDVAAALFERPFLTRWLFDVELLYRSLERFGRERIEDHVVEVPLRRLHDPGGSSLTVSQALRMPLDLLRVRRAYRSMSMHADK